MHSYEIISRFEILFAFFIQVNRQIVIEKELVNSGKILLKFELFDLKIGFSIQINVFEIQIEISLRRISFVPKLT